jgi:plastocyanin
VTRVATITTVYAVLAAILVAAPLAASDPAPGAKLTVAAAASGSVTISDFQFAPASITVDVGDTVTWSNAGPTAHSATATGGSFDTGIFSEGQSRCTRSTKPARSPTSARPIRR